MKIYFKFSQQYESALGGRALSASKEISHLEKEWERYGNSIVKSIEGVTRLRFGREPVDCYVNSKISISSPLSVKIENKTDMFDSLVHELIHQIIIQNFPLLKKPWGVHVRQSKKLGHTFTIWVHVVVHAIHYLVVQEVFDSNTRLKRLMKYSKDKDYRKSWDIVLKRGPQIVVSEIFGRNLGTGSTFAAEFPAA